MTATGGTMRCRIIKFPSVAILALVLVASPLPTARGVVKIFDGFGDADRNNDGIVDVYDTDINISGTLNDPVADAALASRGIIEVTAAEDANDVGVLWSGIRSFDTAANLAKANVKIINDNVATGSETSDQIHNSGLALGVESRGGGSTFIGRFPQSVEVGPVAGDKLTVSVDFRAWLEATNAFTPPDFNELRWGIYEDTDNEFGMTGAFGSGGATVEWGKDDGNFFASQPGAEGDKGIRSNLTFGSFASPLEARINWEYNLAGINSTSNNGRILEGTGVSDTPGSGGDTGTIANPSSPGDGTGGIIQSGTYAPHKLSMEIVRLADGLIEVASFIDDVEILRDAIKETDTGFAVLGPPASSYDYVVFRNSADFDYVIDNFMVEVFGSNAQEESGDFDGDGDVDGRDFLVWQRGDSPNALSAGDLALWQNEYGIGSFAAVAAVPEPSSVLLAAVGTSLILACRRK